MSNTSPVYYCGCLHDVGHFTYAPGARRLMREHDRTSPADCPWPYLDSRKVTPAGKLQQGRAVLRHKDGWTVLSINDYTVDSRPGSHSTFATEGILDRDEMLAAAREQWPEIIERVGDLTWEQTGGRS